MSARAGWMMGLRVVLALIVVQGAFQLLHERDDARRKADPNRWACIQVVRGYAYADTKAEYDSIIDTAASLATSPAVRKGVRSYEQVPIHQSLTRHDQQLLKPFDDACRPYLPFNGVGGS